MQFLHLHAPSLSSARNFSLNLSCRRLLGSGETRWAFYLASLGFRLPRSGAVLQRGRKRGAGGGAGRDRQTPSRDACPPSAFPAGPPEGSRAQATASTRPAEPAGSSTWKGLLGPHRPLRETCGRRLPSRGNPLEPRGDKPGCESASAFTGLRCTAFPKVV